MAFMASKEYDAELSLPSVIIHMPELRRMAVRKKALAALLVLLAILIFVALAGTIYQETTERPIEVVKAETLEVKNTANASSLRLTVKILPENVKGAVVEVDGDVISGSPPYAYLAPSENYHSIRISAPGYEVMSKDVQVGQNEVMTFSLIAKDAPVVSDNQNGDTEQLDEEGEEAFAQNSDDLIEEIVDENRALMLAEPAKAKEGKAASRRAAVGGGRGKSKRGVATAGGPASGSVDAASRRSSGNSGTDASEGVLVAHVADASASTAGTPAVAAASVPEPAAPAAPTKTGDADAGSTAAPFAASAITTVPARPLGAASTTTGGGVAAASPRTSPQTAKASLIVNAPLGVTSRIRVSVDGQMRGYLPVLLKVDPGLHELTFMTDGRRTFQMVKLNPGQIVRIIPNL